MIVYRFQDYPGRSQMLHAFTIAMYCVVQLARYAASSRAARLASRSAAWPETPFGGS